MKKRTQSQAVCKDVSFEEHAFSFVNAYLCFCEFCLQFYSLLWNIYFKFPLSDQVSRAEWLTVCNHPISSLFFVI